MAEKRVILAGGGTGGHIFPALSIAQALQRLAPGTELLFVGARGRMEMEKVPEAGFRIEGLDIAGFDRTSLLRNIRLPFRILKSMLQVRAIFRRFKPDAAVGVGGYSSFPVLRYAQWRGIPTYIHDSNARPGRSNILLGRRADAVFVAAPGMERYFPADRLRLTGNPVRASIRTGRPDRDAAAARFGLDPSRPIILSIGGSLGARSINEAVDAGLDRLLEDGLQIVWQTGKPYADRAAARVQGRSGVYTSAFIGDMGHAYAAADLVISRAGAMSVSEIAATGRPAVFVPYPLAAEDHQTANAKRMQAAGAAVLIPDAEAAERLVQVSAELAGDAERLARMSSAASAQAMPDADATIARLILEDLERRGK